MRKLLWLIPAALYTAFFSWYTDFGGPLSDEEVNAFVTTLQQRDSNPQRTAELEDFLRKDSGRQFLMVNALEMSDAPLTTKGAQSSETAEQLMARYMEHMIPELLRRACHPVIMGTAVHTALDVLGIDGAEQWSDAAVFRYRSRRSFMEIVANPDLKGRHHFKLAALNKTIAYPIEPTLYFGDLRLILGLGLLAIIALLDIVMFGRRRH